MRVLLVQAFTALDMELVYPIGLSYLAAHLDGHAVEVFDLNLHRDDPYPPLAQVIARFRPDVVGVSLRNMKVAMPGRHTDDLQPQQEAIDFIRARLPGAPIIVGGTAFSLYSEAIMRRLPAIDLGCWGEAEQSLPELLDKLDRPWEVKGVYYRDPQSGDVTFTGHRANLDFGTLRHPRRDLVPMEPYLASSFVSVGLQSKRGCALSCIHCSDTWLVGHQVRLRDPVDVVDELQALVEDHGVQQAFFCDLIFNIPVDHAIGICKEIVDRKLDVSWSAWFNEHRKTLPDELMIWLKRAGCGLLSFSPDHVDDRMLKNLDKNFRHADLLYTIDIAKKHGMDVEYSFFLNAPGEDLRSMAAIFRFLVQARLQLGSQLRMFTLLMMNPIRIYPHSRLADLARASGVLDADHDLIEPVYWNPGSLQVAVDGWNATARTLYKARQRWKVHTGAAAPRLSR